MNGIEGIDGKRLLVIGIALVVLGAVAVLAPVFAGSAVVITIGIVLLVAGIGQFIQGMQAQSRGDEVMPLVLGAITGLCRILVIGHPLLGLGFLTLLLAVFFVVEGKRSFWRTLTNG